MLALAAVAVLAGPALQILDPGGRPIAGAKVVPFRFVSYGNPQPFPALVADAQGAIDLSGPPERPRELSSVVAFAPGFGAAWTSLSSPSAPALPLVLRLHRETVLHLIVRSDRGSPLPNVAVRPSWLCDRQGATRIPTGLSGTWLLKTDEKGTVVMPGLPQGASLIFENRDPRFSREPVGISLGTDSISNGELRLKATVGSSAVAPSRRSAGPKKRSMPWRTSMRSS